MIIHALSDGAIRFLRPDGQSFDSVAASHNHPRSNWLELPKQHRDHDIVINARTAVTRWDGGPMDFGMGVDGLLRRWREAKNPPRGGFSAD